MLSVKSSSCVQMMSRNLVAPFKFSRTNCAFVFGMTFVKLEDYLPQMNQLWRAATLPPVDQNGMIAAFDYSRQSRLPFDKCSLESVKESILFKVNFPVDRVSHFCKN